jgi:hypothetical protein
METKSKGERSERRRWKHKIFPSESQWKEEEEPYIYRIMERKYLEKLADQTCD